MKRYLFVFLFLAASISAVFAQRIPVLAVMPFEATNRGVTPDEAANTTRQIIAELNSWGTLNIIQTEAGSDYILKGTLALQANNIVLLAQTIETRSGKSLGEIREQGAALKDISIFSVCARAVDKVPLPNYLLGTWQSTLNMPDGPVVCIIEFKSDRTVFVERYDTWEHRQRNALRYEGYGTGTYSYAGYFVRRNITVNSQQIQIDAMANINLTLEETLPEQTAVNQTRLGIIFNGDKSTFEIAGSSLPCGRNYDGPSIYPSEYLGFSRFTKIK